MLAIAVIAVVAGLYMAWNIGANDFANSMGDAVGSGAITVRTAVLLGAAFEFAGSTIVGSHVTDTLRRGIVDPVHFVAVPELLLLGMLCALVGTSLWLNVATWLGMPVSTTHGIVGAVAGFGIVAVGFSGVEWSMMGGIVASWVISPVAGGFLAWAIFRLVSRFILGQERPLVQARAYGPVAAFAVVIVVCFSTLYKSLGRLLAARHVLVPWWLAVSVSVGLGVAAALAARALIGRAVRGREDLPLADQLALVERIFAPMVVATSCSVAFAHGANDVANAIGPLAAVFDILGTGSANLGSTVPFWVFALGGGGIVLGLATFGYRVMATIGTRITQLTPSRGVAGDLATATTVLVCTLLSLPVSTTHTIVGAVIGIGLARGMASVNRRVVRDIVASWLVTVPAAALVTMGLFVLCRALGADVFIRSALAR